MTLLVDLPPKAQSRLRERAAEAGKEENVLAALLLTELLVPEEEDVETDELAGGTLADLLKGRTGLFRSSERIPGGARMSENTGKQFADGMEEKRRRGHL